MLEVGARSCDFAQDDRQPITGNRQPATDNRQPATVLLRPILVFLLHDIYLAGEDDRV